MAKFANLIVKNNLIVNKMNDVDIRPEVLSNIVRTDQESKVKGKTIFTGDVTINNLESKAVLAMGSINIKIDVELKEATYTIHNSIIEL